MYNIIENEIVPLFYTRTADGLPRAWVKRMKNSISRVSAQFNTRRMLSEYTQKFYISAANRWKFLSDNQMSEAKNLAQWQKNFEKVWQNLEISKVIINTIDDQTKTTDSQLTVGMQLNVRALVNLDTISPDDVTIEVYHGPVDSWGDIKNGSPVRLECKTVQTAQQEHWFEGIITCDTAGRHGLAVRLLPHHPALSNPYEMGLILWEESKKKATVRT